MAIDRRQFLKRGLVGGAVLVVGSASLGAWEGDRRFKPTGRLNVLDAFSFAVFAAAAEAVLDGQKADPVVIAHRMDTTLAYAPPEAQDDVKKLAKALNSPVLGLMLDARPRPFLALSVDGRAAALRNWRESGLALRKSGYHALRKLVVSSYYADSSTWSAIGYPGPPMSVKGAAR